MAQRGDAAGELALRQVAFCADDFAGGTRTPPRQGPARADQIAEAGRPGPGGPGIAEGPSLLIADPTGTGKTPQAYGAIRTLLTRGVRLRRESNHLRRPACAPAPSHVMDVVLGQVGRVPGNGPVVGVIMEDSEAVMGRGGGDDEVHSGAAAMLSSLSHTVLRRANQSAPRSSEECVTNIRGPRPSIGSAVNGTAYPPVARLGTYLGSG
ncbi:hypothetical protein GCM10010255_17030 [Streptomyces coeruleofuscus]|uniref:Uncharacterized protein n=1 Tax=Streptomyces coeruleofuscus TaxID=66879 RepID=A0ABP5UY69_9ACTN